MTPAEKYTAAAYLVVFVGVLAYVLIIAAKLQRLQRELAEIAEALRDRGAAPVEAPRIESTPVETGTADG